MTTLKSMLIDYCHRGIDGVVAWKHCQKDKWAMMRFLRDIDRENTDEFPYYFDEEAALRFLKWMTNFKHSISEGW